MTDDVGSDSSSSSGSVSGSSAGLSKGLSSALGALTGVVALIAMVRLIAGAGFTSAFAWVFLLGAMLPWIGYCVWRARHGHLRVRAGLAVLALAVVGLVSAWLFTLGPVIALACSLVAFVVIWVHDWPQPRDRRESTYVRVEDLTSDPDYDVPAEEHPDWPYGISPEPESFGAQPGDRATETPRNAA